MLEQNSLTNFHVAKERREEYTWDFEVAEL